MPSNFPSGPDTILNNVSNSTPEVDTHPGVHNQLADAVMAVENSLLPGGSMNLAAHVSASDPHPVYLTQPEGDARYALIGGGGSIPAGSITTTEIADGTIQPIDMAAGTAAANVGTLGGALTGTLPNPGLAALPANSVGSSQIADGSVAATDMAAGAAATNVGTLGGVLTGTLPNPGLVPVTSAMIADGTITGADIATGAITTTQIADGTIATADLANAAVTNAKLGTDTARLNLLTNGGFEVQQRGGAAVATGYCADRWLLGPGAGSAFSAGATGGVLPPTGSSIAESVTYTHSAASSISQKLEGQQLAGLTVSFSMMVRCNAANAVRLRIDNNIGGGGTPGGYHPGDNTWQKLTVTQAISAGAVTSVYATIEFNATCIAYLDNAMLVVGSVAADYAPLHPADDLARCLRYYEVYGSGQIASGMHYSTTTTIYFLPIRVQKSVTPTVTVTNPGNLWGYTSTATGIAYTSVSADSVTAQALRINCSGGSGFTAGQASLLWFGGAGSLAIEANP